MGTTGNRPHALQRTRRGIAVCSRRVWWAGSLSLGLACRSNVSNKGRETDATKRTDIADTRDSVNDLARIRIGLAFRYDGWAITVRQLRVFPRL